MIQPTVSYADIIAQVRKEYLAHFREAIHSYRKGTEVVPELLLEMARDSNMMGRLYRIDLALAGEAPRLVSVCVDGSRSLEWDNCSFEIDVATRDWHAIEEWFRKWIDENDERVPDEFGLSGVIHSASVEQNGERINFTVDFGSAPVDAFFELARILDDIGTWRIVNAN